jgi:hypothetical protein
MCNYKTLRNSEDGYVVRCKSCDHIQVAFSTSIQSFTRDQFYDYIIVVEELYKRHRSNPFREQKIVRIATAARAVVMVYNVDEVSRLLGLMIAGRNRLEREQLFVFNEN